MELDTLLIYPNFITSLALSRSATREATHIYHAYM